MKLTLEATIRGMMTGHYTPTPKTPMTPKADQGQCNYTNDYYGDQICQHATEV